MAKTKAEAEPTESEELEDKGATDLPGQLVYPDREVDAERAAAYASFKETTLEPDRDETENERVARIQMERADAFREEQESESA